MQLRDTADLKVPAARMVDLVTTESKDEVLVYDQAVHHIHHLNATASAVWKLCDGKRTVRDIAEATSIDEEAVRLALRKLEEANLLEGDLAMTMRGTHSRRAFMRRAVVAGAISVPVIVSITAPAAANHTSGCALKHGGETCQNKHDCCSNVCTNKMCVGG